MHSAAYVHGHQVGGTNPSLVEALGAGNAVVADKSAMYFSGADGFARCMDELEDNPAGLENLRQQALIRFQEAFTWPDVLAQYEALLTRYLPG